MDEKLPELPLTDDTRTARKPGLVRRLIKGFFLILCVLLLLVGVSGAGLFFWLGTDSARTLVLEHLNAQLKEPLAKQGLGMVVHRLTGTLPFHWVAGLELSDKDGLFFKAPETRFDFTMGLFPPRLELSQLLFVQAELLRMPVLQESEELPPPEPTAPLTPETLKALLDETVKTVLGLPTWLPEIAVHKTGLEELRLPASLLGVPATLSTEFDAGFGWKEKLPGPAASLGLPTFSLVSDDLNVEGKLIWTSGSEEATWLDGNLDVRFKVSANPQAFFKDRSVDSSAESKEQESRAQPLTASPLHLDFALTGPLFAPTLSLESQCAQLTVADQTLSDISLRLSAAPLNLRGFLALAGQAEPLRLDLSLNGKVNGEDVRLAVGSGARLASHTEYSSFVAELSRLDLNALGLALSGAFSTHIQEGAIPLVRGELSAAISDWHALEPFLSGQKISGSLDAKLVLTGRDSDKSQDCALTLSIPSLALSSPEGEAFSVKTLRATVDVKDALAHPGLAVSLRCEQAASGDLKIGLATDVSGALEGPLHLHLTSTGSVRSALVGDWAPGTVHVERLSVDTHPGLLGQDFARASTPLGIKLSKPCLLTYGEAGFGVDALDIGIAPAGRLTLTGGLTKDGCDLGLKLAAFDLSAWQKLIDALPQGIVEADCALKGPSRGPAGHLRLNVKNLKLKGVRLDPMDLALLGQLEQSRGRFNVRLEVPEKTVRTLGGEKMEVAASLPVRFAENGVPELNTEGSLAGRILWKGKLAPLWKLTPLTDRRLNGTLDCALDIAGKVSAPSLRGQVKVEKGRFEDPILGLLLRDIGCLVSVDGKSSASGLDGGVKITAGLADGMGGKLTVNGTSRLDASSFDIQTRIDHLHPLRRQDVRLSLSGDVKVTGSAKDPRVTGALTVDNGAIQLENIEGGTSSVTALPISEAADAGAVSRNKERTEQKRTKNEKTETAGSGFIDLRISSPGRFLVDGFGLFSEWKTDLAIRGPLTEPVISGEVSAVKGSLDFLNKLFKLEKGIITLGGGNLANPLIDMLLTNAGTEVTSHIHIAGTVKKMKLSLSSEPEMPKDDVMAHILFGRSANELGRYEALELAAAMAKTASGFGRGMNSPRKALGLDVMRLKSGGGSSSSSGGSGMSNMAVESGKYINDSIYVGVEQGMKEGSTAGTIQLELTPRLKFELRSQQDNTSGSLNWKYNY